MSNSNNVLNRIESRIFNVGDYVAHYWHVPLDQQSDQDDPTDHLYMIIGFAKNESGKCDVIYQSVSPDKDIVDSIPFFHSSSYEHFVSEVRDDDVLGHPDIDGKRYYFRKVSEKYVKDCLDRELKLRQSAIEAKMKVKKEDKEGEEIYNGW